MPDSPNRSGNGQAGLAVGVRMGVEMVVATCLGGGIGYLADGHWDTLPWFTLVGVLLGTAAGIRNVLRMSARMMDNKRL